MDSGIAGMGHNQPPMPTAEEMREFLAEQNEEALNRARELYDAAAKTGAVCATEEEAQAITDRIALITKCKKSLEATREGQKEPFLTLGRAVDGFFKPVTEGLDKAKTRLSSILGSYLDKKAREERDRRAKEAEEKRLEAERIAREEREKAEAARREAEAAAALAAEQEAAQMPALAAQTLDTAITAERTAARSEKEADKAIGRAERHADKAEKAAEAKPSQMAHVHGGLGGRAGLKTKKVVTVTSRDKLELEALRPHFKAEHLQAAMESWMRANWKDEEDAPTFPGAVFERETSANVRG